ncbi:barstar family protein [Streptosporangium amethystogenes subsp. fukuiense]|uniref:Barstar family protein n=1 Tax=Streptosporangium amethystogenes subsp. fukuiense TaxID=698418 RepID=A0ABW2TAF5_9ACTN
MAVAIILLIAVDQIGDLRRGGTEAAGGCGETGGPIGHQSKGEVQWLESVAMTIPALPGARWLLLDEYTGEVGEADVVVGVCYEIDGLFVDPLPIPPPETFTLLGCDPAGPLRDVLGHLGTERAWLPSIALFPVHRQRPARCLWDEHGCTCVEELIDVTVVGRRPSATQEGLVDLDLSGYIRLLPEWGLPEDKPDVTGFRLAALDDEKLGECLDVADVFRKRPSPPVRPVTLIGFRPEAPWTGTIEGRKITASIMTLQCDGRTAGGAGLLSATVVTARPSKLGDGLLDITLDGGIEEPTPSGAREIFQTWYDGGPAESNLWARYDRLLQHEWSGLALCHRPQGLPDKPTEATYHLDGRFVTDIDAFYCAIGEAINGPGGYFGWNLDALDDCLRGGWGATSPFRLVWHHSDVARRHLAAGYDRPAHRLRDWGPSIGLDDLLRIFSEHDIEVEFR